MPELGRRILIVGSSGSGKSTLALALGQRLGLPVRHLDQMTWLPGWALRDRVETDRAYEAALKEPDWIVDSAFARHLPVAVAAAETVLFLDYSVWLCLARVAKRVWSTRGRVRRDMAPGCPEQVDLQFLWWIWRWQRTHRPKYLAALEGQAKARSFRRPGELQTWLNGAE
jgi:adenylate kinase family enzyme